MADSAGIKNSEKNKLTNSVSRTTSETLRLADPDKVSILPNTLSTSTPKKKTSFQITSVIVGSRSSNDGGDDSADDLDESHTEDISEVVDNSRVTDIENETPSYSEDTFSKDDVFFNASSSLVSAPVIPTSSQYGLAILASTDNCESALNQTINCENSGTTVEVTESVINLGVVSTKHDPEMRDMHPPAPRTERFKVVKIESTEPFKRGRWVCMDYLDHNIAQNQAVSVKADSENSHQNTGTADFNSVQENNSVPANNVTPAEEIVQSTVAASSPLPVVSGSITEPITNSNPVNIQSTDNQPIVSNMPISAPSALPTSYASVSPGQSLQNNMQMPSNTVVTSAQPQVSQQAQSLSQVHMQQIMANSNQHQSLQSQQIQQVLANANVMPLQQTQQQTQQQQAQQPPQSQQPPPQQPPQSQQAQIQGQMQQQTMMQQPMQQMPSMQQYQPQQQQFQPMQQQTMMPQQMATQQTMQQQLQPVQQVHMQQGMPQNMQQMPMQQQQGQQVQQQQMMPQQMQQMSQQPVHQVSYSQPTQQAIVSQNNGQQQVPPGMYAPMQNFQTNQMMGGMPPQPIMNIQSQPHLQPQYYPTSMPQTTTMTGGMIPSMSQGSSLPVSMQGSTATLPPLQTYASIQQVPNMPQTPPVQTSVQYSLPCSMAGPQPPVQAMSQQLPNLMQQTPQSYASIGSPAQSYASSVVSSLPTSIAEPVSVLSSIGSTAEQPPSAIPTDYMPAPTAALLESLAEVTASPDEQQQQTSEDPERSVYSY